MMIMPPPTAPYWPACDEPERSRLEAAYRAEHEKWWRETRLTMTTNLAWPVLMICIAAALVWVATWAPALLLR